MPVQKTAKSSALAQTAKSTAAPSKAKPAASPTPSPKPAEAWTAGAKKTSVSPLAVVYPDLKNDGKVVDLKTGKATDFSLSSLKKNTYYPKGSEDKTPMVFTEGANHWLVLGAEKAKEHADTLGTPMGVIHNGSLVTEPLGKGGLPNKANRLLENIGNVLLNKDLVSEQSVKNLTVVMTDAIENNKPAYITGESQGSILVGQALNKTKEAYVKAHSTGRSAKDKAAAVAAFEKKSGENLHILTLGNAYDNYPKGPNYLHVFMKGDPMPRFGTRPDNHSANAKMQYINFDQLFPGKSAHENHNTGLQTRLLQRTFEINNIPKGDLPALFKASQDAFIRGTSLKMPRLDDVQWPADMQSKFRPNAKDFDQALKDYSAAHPKR
jgi:hypothetical protein